MLREKDILRGRDRKKKAQDLLSKSETDATKKIFYLLATEAPQYVFYKFQKLGLRFV